MIRLQTFICVVLLTFIAARATSANVGETREELFKRYGAGKDMEGVMLYRLPVENKDETQHFSVSVYLSNDRSVMEVFSRGHDEHGKRIPLSQDDIQRLLNLNSKGLRWLPYRAQRSGRRMWRRLDGRVLAHYSKGEAALIMMNPEVEGTPLRERAKSVPRQGR